MCSSDNFQISDEILLQLRSVQLQLQGGATADTIQVPKLLEKTWFATKDPVQMIHLLDTIRCFGMETLELIVNLQDSSSGNTAMHFAAASSNYGIIDLLLQSTCFRVDSRNKAGVTALMIASSVDDSSMSAQELDVFRTLANESGVNDRIEADGRTALILAAHKGRTRLVECLLSAGADPNLSDEDGSTPLMCAAENGHVDVIKALLVHPSCDATLLDCDGYSALQIALDAGHTDTVKLLYRQKKKRSISVPTIKSSTRWNASK